MKPRRHAVALTVQAAARKLLSHLLLRLQAWRKNSSWQSRYTRAQHGQGSRVASRLAVDLGLLGGVVLIPLTIFFWSKDSEQQQLARLASDPTRYVEGWQMAQTRSRVFFNTPALVMQTNPHAFFDTPSPAAQELAVQPSSHGAAHLWEIRCDRLYETLSSRRPQSEQDELAIPTRHLQCRGRAKVHINDMTLTTKRLSYEKKTQGYRLTTDRPVLVREGSNRLSSLGGGIVADDGEMILFRDILFQAPGLQINAQGEFQGINLLDKNFSKKESPYKNIRRVLIFKRDITFSFQALSKRYHGMAQLAKLLPCPEKPKIECLVFGSDAISRIVLMGSVVVSEMGLDAETLWTLQAKRVMVHTEKVYYLGGKKDGKYGNVRIVLADGTQLIGHRGNHNLSNNSGLLCGKVEVQSGEGVLTGSCLRYNLTEKRYTLESSASERELMPRDYFRR